MSIRMVVGERGGVSQQVTLSATPARLRTNGALVQGAAAKTVVAEPIALDPLTDRDGPSLSITGIGGPGEYETEVAATVTGWAPFRKKVKLFVHLDFRWAIGAILIGVVISSLFRYFYLVKQPAWSKGDELRQVRLAMVTAVAQAGVPEAERLAQTLVGQCLQIEEELRKSGESSQDAADQILVRMRALPDWARTFEWARSLDAIAQMQTLNTLARELADPDDRGDPAAKYPVVRAELDKRVQTQLVDPIANFEDALRQSPVADPAVATKLQEAKALVASGKNSEAEAAYADARALYTVARGRDLPGRLGNEPALNDADGRALVQQLDAIAKATTRENYLASAAHLEKVALRIVARLCRALEDQIATAQAVVDKTRTLEPAVKEKLLRRIAAVLALAQAAAAEIEQEDALGMYERARDDWKAVVGEIPVGALGGPGLDQLPVSLGFLPSVRFLPSAPAPLEDLPTLKDDGARRRKIEVAVTVASFGVAILAGMQSLGVDAATWGGSADLIKAVVWGLGIHQAAGALFVGIPNLQKRLG